MYFIYMSELKSFKIFVDREPDQTQSQTAGLVYGFKANQVLPVYIYFNRLKKGYLIRTCPGRCRLPNVDRPVTELLSVSGYKVGYLKKLTNALRKYKLILDDLPDQFFVRLSLVISAPHFSKEKAFRIYKEFRNLHK